MGNVCKSNRNEIVVFRKGGILKKYEKCFLKGQKLEIIRVNVHS